ncbi:MAG: helix-turn-helix domain-containing protein [Polyangiales bacterium]|nr:helix-turn-helix domain-containing protein [Myxococcales bacterium]MCB9661026.1 helix-turn-helix domain-containing protein [Sandaracinaceae bacterium]
MEFSSEGLRFGERVEGYRDGLRRAYFEMDVEPLSPGPFEGAIRTCDTAALKVGRIAGSPQNVLRGARSVRDSGQHGYFLNIQLRGRGVIEQRGKRVLLDVGQAAFVHAASEFAFRFPTPFEQLSLYIPDEFVPRAKRDPDMLAATALPVTGVVPRMLVAMVDTIAASGELDPSDALTAEEQLLALVQASFKQLPNVPDDLEARLLVWLEQHLTDPQLDLDMAARGLGASRRAIQYCMQRLGESFSGRVRRRRVERAQLLLRDPAWRLVPVLDIALRVGFSDATTFSRAFRRETGSTASAYRSE